MNILYAHEKIFDCRRFLKNIYISYPTVSYAYGKCMQSQGLRLQPAQIATAYTNTLMTKYRVYPCNRKTRKNNSITAISKI